MTAGSGNTMSDPKEAILENLKFLREYARHLLVEDDDSLVPIKDLKDALMKEYLAVGDTLGLTERDLMMLVLKNILDQCVWY